jgi:hypothetical protein
LEDFVMSDEKTCGCVLPSIDVVMRTVLHENNTRALKGLVVGSSNWAASVGLAVLDEVAKLNPVHDATDNGAAGLIAALESLRDPINLAVMEYDGSYECHLDRIDSALAAYKSGNQAQQPAAVDEREAFSTWADPKGFVLDCAFFSEELNNFEDADTRLAFDIWLGRAALAGGAQ